KVYATDLQPEMLDLLRARLARDKLANVELVLATEHDAKLAERSIDLALLVDVYHELADPAAVMAGVRRALRDGGRLVLVEYRGVRAGDVGRALARDLDEAARQLVLLGERVEVDHRRARRFGQRAAPQLGAHVGGREAEEHVVREPALERLVDRRGQVRRQD